MKRIVPLLLICAFLLSFIAPIEGRVRPVDPRLVDSIERFLVDWLVNRKPGVALAAFDERSLMTFRGIDIPCEPLVDAYERGHTNDQREKAARALFDYFAAATRGSSLEDTFFFDSSDNPERSRQLSAKVTKLVVPHTSKARFYLIPYARWPHTIDLPSTVRQSTARKHGYLCVVQFRVLNDDVRYGDDLILAVLWLRMRGDWRIVYLTAECD